MCVAILAGAGAGCAPRPVTIVPAQVAVVARAETPRVSARAVEHLVEVDLCDDWAPRVLSPRAVAPPRYREVFVALANGQLDAPGVRRRARSDRSFELFGIPPSPSLVRTRLGEHERHECHDAVDDDALADTTVELRTDARTRKRDRTAARRHAVRAVESHLACDGMLAPRLVDGVFDDFTTDAVAKYQRRHVILRLGIVDDHTRATMLEDSRELEVRAALRMLRERIVDATGLLEDGSASQAWQPVLGRMLDPPELRRTLGRPPLAGGAPDRIAVATDMAARSLGWTDAAAIEASLGDLEASCRVRLPLPPSPRWQDEPHTLRVEIDRGDVSYRRRDAPSGRAGSSAIERTPTLTVFVVHGGVEEPVVRWPTTIGGWKRQRLPSGAVVMRYKPSDPGSFVWRDVVAAPTWFPPTSTPDADLLRQRPDGRWWVREEIVGPGYRSAYGLAMLVHERRVPATGTRPATWVDEGIRTHGTSSYLSVYGDQSHGCHRLPNHLALRLTSFVLRETSHQVIGPVREPYGRALRGGALHIRRDSRGFVYRLDAPIPVEVLEGRVLGAGVATPRETEGWRTPRPRAARGRGRRFTRTRRVARAARPRRPSAGAR